MNAHRLSAWLVAGIPLLYVACGGEGLTLPSEGEPAHIIVLQGDGQNGRVGDTLALRVVVKVTDTQQRPVEGAPVDFTFDDPSAGGAATPPSTTTDANGEASSQIRLGSRVGALNGHATVPVPEGTVPVTVAFTATAVSADAAGIAMVSGDDQQAPVGTALPQPLVVQVTDIFGNPIPNVTIDWTVTGGGQVSQTSTPTDGNGQASVVRTLGSTAGDQTAQANAAGLVGSPVVFSHIATAGAAARIVKVDGDNQNGPAGTQLPNPLVVQVLDEANNPVVGRAVTWVVGNGGGSVSPETSNTDPEGRASTRWTLGSSGNNTVNAVVSGVGTATFSATATASAAARIIKVSGDNQNGPAGTELQSPLVVQVLDEANNPVVGRAVTWVVGNGGGSVSPETSNTDPEGRASTRWTLGSSGNNTVNAVVSGLGTATFRATATAGGPSASRSRVSVDDESIPVGATATITVRVRDAGGNAVEGVPVSVSSSGTGNEITPASATSGEDGVATFSFRSTVAENKTITVVAGGVTLDDRRVITVFRLGTTTEITDVQPEPSTAGQEITVTFRVTGEGGGTPTGTVTIFSLQEADVGCTVPVSQGSCVFTLNQAGTHRLGATYSGDSQFEDSADPDGREHVVLPGTP